MVLPSSQVANTYGKQDAAEMHVLLLASAAERCWTADKLERRDLPNPGTCRFCLQDFFIFFPCRKKKTGKACIQNPELGLSQKKNKKTKKRSLAST